MSTMDSNDVREKIESIKFMYENAEMYPTTFESFVLPAAVYNQAGVILQANKMFRTAACLTEEEVLDGKAKINESLNQQIKALTDATEDVFQDREILLSDLSVPLVPKAESVEILSTMYTQAAFFPMTYAEETVEYAAVMLIR